MEDDQNKIFGCSGKSQAFKNLNFVISLLASRAILPILQGGKRRCCHFCQSYHRLEPPQLLSFGTKDVQACQREPSNPLSSAP